MSALKSYFPPGYPRNIWHLLLLISAFFATAFTIVDLVLISGETFPILLLMLGFVVLSSFCLLEASGIVRYWALFLWLGLFLLFEGFIILPATYVPAGYSSSYSITYQLFYLLGNVLLLVFFWNLGNLDRRILAPLFLIFTLLLGTLFFLNPGWSAADIGLMFGYTVGFIIYFVFYSLFVIMAVNSIKLLKLPGFHWLFAGFSLFLFSILLMVLGDSCFKNIMEPFFPFLFILNLSSLVLMIIGASIFTVKMDPAQLEERLRKAAPAKEVDSGVQNA